MWVHFEIKATMWTVAMPQFSYPLRGALKLFSVQDPRWVNLAFSWDWGLLKHTSNPIISRARPAATPDSIPKTKSCLCDTCWSFHPADSTVCHSWRDVRLMLNWCISIHITASFKINYWDLKSMVLIHVYIIFQFMQQLKVYNVETVLYIKYYAYNHIARFSILCRKSYCIVQFSTVKWHSWNSLMFNFEYQAFLFQRATRKHLRTTVSSAKLSL